MSIDKVKSFLDQLKHYDENAPPNCAVGIEFQRWELKAIIELVEAAELIFKETEDWASKAEEGELRTPHPHFLKLRESVQKLKGDV